MTPTPKLSMQKQIRKKREQKPRCYHPALRRTRAAEHLPPSVICVSCIPDGFAGPSEASRFFLAHSLLRARESAVIISIQVGVVDHQLSNDFALLALQRIDASKCPLRPARVRSHLSDDAGFIHFRGVAEYGLWFILQNLLRQCRVKAQADVEVIALRESQFAIRGFPDRGFAASAFASVFHEVEKSDNRNDVPLAKISQRRSRLCMVTAA